MDSLSFDMSAALDSVNKSRPKGKIYLLRHEQREQDISITATLTSKGLVNSAEIVAPKLKECNIATIYCSPFLRTLQTIEPFCKATGMKVNQEWSLSESIPSLPPNFKGFPVFDCITNSDYISKLSPTTPSGEISSYSALQTQVSSFLSQLDRSENVLLVTHLPVINAALSVKGVQIIDMYEHRANGSLICLHD